MFKSYSVLFFLFVFIASVNSQELNFTITINSEQVRGTNKQVFTTLERALQEFVNGKQWTNKVFNNHERIECGMTLIITTRENNSFSGSLQVNAVRPVYGSNYKTPVFNFKDNDFSFEYTEYEPLIYNPSTYESNLVSLISYYVYMILAIDSDTFALKGGTSFYEQALDIANIAQQGNYAGWEVKRNSMNRYALVDLILSPAHKEYREVMYYYHRKGMDVFAEDKQKAKEEIYNQIMSFETLNKRSQNSFLFRVFFDAKSNEVVDVFKDGPSLDVKSLKQLLGRISAPNSAKWKNIK